MLTDWLKLGERAITALERLAAAAEERNRILGSPFPIEVDGQRVPYIEETRTNGTRVG